MARLLLLLALLLPGAARAAVPSVFLVQDSGWMEPFFTDPGSPFKPLLKALVAAAQTGRTVVADFNQDGQIPGRRSPGVVFDGPYAAGPVAAAIDGIGLATRPGGRLADADIAEALTRAIDTLLGNRPGIVWIVTNNKSSRNNDPAIERNTRAFAELIRSTQALPVADAYPVRMPVTGRQYTERGLMIYAVAYGDEAAVALDSLVAAAPLRQLFTDPPFRLKRLEQAPIAFVPRAAEAPVTAALAADDTLVLRGVPAAGGTVRVSGTLRSDYYPQTVQSAAVSLRWLSLDGVADPTTLPAAVQPATLRDLAARGTSEALTLDLATPAVMRPPGLSGLLARTETRRGQLELRLSDLKLALAPDFTAKMGEIAALDQLPDVFADYQRVSAATALVPVVLVVHFSAWPFVLLLGGGGAALLVLLGLLVLLLRPRRYVVEAAGLRRAVALRPFQSVRFPLTEGGSLLVRGRLFGAPSTRRERGGAL